ncbi:MAG: Fic family protein [Eggerthellaceae bacterium]|nr:Fic family protein [Eggerthellaceae bacterium]
MYDEERPYDVIADNKDRAYRQRTWDTASGLQAVDGLTVSAFAQEAAASYISGEYGTSELKQELESHYEGEQSRQAEADIVAGRIVGMLSGAETSTFKLAPEALRRIHKLLFDGQLPDVQWAGNWRTENIAKAEPVLGGRTVAYGDWEMISDLLAYDFDQERAFRYDDIRALGEIRHFADFIASIWQVHPFREGNTRTIATFAQIYLAQFGIAPGNDLFRDNSTWFRDALVRASYSSIRDGIEENPAFIRAFFENIIIGAGNDIASMDLNLHGVRVSNTPYRQH